MATETLELVVRTTGAKPAADDIRGIGTSAKESAASLNVMADTLRLMRNVLVGFSFIRAFEGIGTGISQMQQLNNLLTTVTSSLSQQYAGFQALGNAANEVRAPMAAFTQLFTNITRSTAAYKMSTDDAIKATKTLFATFAISGLDENSIRNVTRDMKEVFNLGTVQGRIFRSVVMQDQEESLVLSKYIVATGQNAAAVNKQLDEMRAKGQQPDIYQMVLNQADKGAFTGGDIARAQIAAFDDEMQKLSKTNITLGQGFIILNNYWLMFLDNLEVSGAIFTNLGNSLVWVGQNLEGLLELLLLISGVLVTKYIVLPMAEWFLAWASATALATAQLIAFSVVSATLFAIELPSSIAAATAAVWAFLLAVDAVIPSVIADIITITFSVGVLILDLISLEPVVWASIGSFALAAAAPLISLAALALLVDGLVHAVLGAIAPLMQLSGVFDGINVSMSNLPKVFAGVNSVLINDWSDVTAVFSAVWQDMLNGMTNAWDKWADGIGSSLVGKGMNKVLSSTTLGETGQNVMAMFGHGKATADTNLPTNTSATAISRLNMDLFYGMAGNGPKPFQTDPQPNQPADQPEKVSKYMQALKSLMDLVAKFDGPMAKFNKDQEDSAARFTTLQKVLGGETVTMVMAKAGYDDYNETTHSSAKMTEDMRLAILGMSDGVRKATDNQNIYNDALATGDTRLLTYANQVKHLNDKIADIKNSNNTIEGGMDIAGKQEQIRSGDNTTLATKLTTDLVFQQIDARRDLNTTIAVTNQLVAEGSITQAQATKAIQDANLAVLKFNQDATSGFKEGFIKVQQDMANSSEMASQVVVNAYDKMTDAIVKFAETGKFDVKSMVSSVTDDLIKMEVKQNITGPAMGFLGKTLGLDTSSGQLGANASNAMWVQVVGMGNDMGSFDPSALGAISPGSATFANGQWTPGAQGFPDPSGGLSSLLGGGSGGMGDLSSILNGSNPIVGSLSGDTGIMGGMSDALSWVSSLFGFAGGGDFQVGGDGATDSQLVAFRASPNEHVSVKTPTQMRDEATQGQSGGQHIHLGGLHLHGVQDVDSFQRSQGQVMSGLSQMLSKTVVRNGGK